MNILKNGYFAGLAISFITIALLIFVLENGAVEKSFYHAEYLLSNSQTIETDATSHLSAEHPCDDMTIRVARRSSHASTFCGGRIFQSDLTTIDKYYSAFYSFYSFEENGKRKTVVYLNKYNTASKEKIVSDIKNYVRLITESVQYDLTIGLELEKAAQVKLDEKKNTWG